MQPQRVVCKYKGEIGSPFSYVETEKTPRFIIAQVILFSDTATGCQTGFSSWSHQKLSCTVVLLCTVF